MKDRIRLFSVKFRDSIVVKFSWRLELPVLTLKIMAINKLKLKTVTS